MLFIFIEIFLKNEEIIFSFKYLLWILMVLSSTSWYVFMDAFWYYTVFYCIGSCAKQKSILLWDECDLKFILVFEL